MKNSEILAEARDLIEEGWCINALDKTYPDGSKSYCAVGAVLQVVYENGLKWGETWIPLNDLLEEACGGYIVHFNNSQLSAEPVIRVFNEAIAMAKWEESRIASPRSTRELVTA